MTAMLLTHDNLDYAKGILREKLPQIKSSHLTEALAFSAGYRTHAALRADLDRTGRPPLSRINDDKFVTRLSEFGYSCQWGGFQQVVSPATPPLPILREFKGRDVPAINRWFKECERRSSPLVYITMARKYAKLEWDCITVDPEHDQNIVRDDTGNDLGRAMYKAFQQHCSTRTGYYLGSAFVGSIEGLLLNDARRIAEEIFVMLYSALRREDTQIH